MSPTNSFKKILIPVDLSFNTEVAIKKCMELSDSNTVIHLLHVQTYDLNGWSVKSLFREKHKNNSSDRQLLDRKLDEWKTTIESHVRNITVCVWIVMGDSIEDCIKQKAKQLDVDLIIIGKTSHHSWMHILNTVTPANISQETGIAVLTVKPGSIFYRTKIVIAPIACETDMNKMKAIESFCKKFKVHIYLVAFVNDKYSHTFDASAVLQAYQWLKTSIHCQVQYEVLHGVNRAAAILDYAKKKNADLLIVNPETETKLGWLNTRIVDVLPPDSKVQVLAV